MSLRLRLALAFLLLSVVPLAAFAAWSYVSSKQALRAAAQAEAESTARELEARVAEAATDIDRRLRVLSRVPVATWIERTAGGEELSPALAELGEALPYLDGLEFVAAAAPPAPPTPATPTVAAVAPVPPTPQVATVSGFAPTAPAAPPAPREPGEVMSAAEQKQLAELAQRVALRSLAGVEAGGELAVELVKLQAVALDAAARAGHLKAEKLATLGFAEMAARIEAQAKQIEASAARMETTDAAAEIESERRAVEVARVGGEHDGSSGSVGSVGSGDSAGSAGSSLSCSVSDGERVVGKLQAKLKSKQLFHSVLSRVDRKRGEIPFAIGEERALLSASRDDAYQLESIAAIEALRTGERPSSGADDWIVVARQDPATGYQLGIARPLSGAMAELKRAVARNFALGFVLVGLATIGFFPLTSGLVRTVRELDRGAARIASGDLATRVAVRGKDELARLGASFNRMAEQLASHQEQLLAEERRRKEEEISRRLLAAENERRGRELEEARDFQLSLLPRELPKIAGLDLAVEMTTATEVGGDYYDFQTADSGELVIAIGDATGHGAAAGTLVTAVKSLFAAGAATQTPAAFLGSANAAIHRMGLVRRAMALTVARVSGDWLKLSAAGMPPVLLFRQGTSTIEEIALPGTPLGSRADFPYLERDIAFAPGDALLFLSDGLPELPNCDGEPFGYERLAAEFARLAAGSSACEVVTGLRAAARAWGGDRAPVDDVTLLVVRRT